MSTSLPESVAPRIADPAEGTALAKVRWRLLPFLFLLFMVCFLDRVNVGFAALQMNRDLGLSPAVYGFGAGIFFLGYVLCEVPSNLLLARMGARVWIARIMITCVNDHPKLPTNRHLKFPTQCHSADGAVTAGRSSPARRFSFRRYESPLMLTVVA